MMHAELYPDLHELWNDRLVGRVKAKQRDLEAILAPYGMSLDRAIKDFRQVLPPMVSLDRLMEIRREQTLPLVKSLQSVVYDKKFKQTVPDDETLEYLLNVFGLLDAKEYKKIWEIVTEGDYAQRLHPSFLTQLNRSLFLPTYNNTAPENKLLSLNKVQTAIADARKNGVRVVTTYGVFDFHGNHQRVFEEARQIAVGGLVIALLSSDEEVMITRQGQTVEPISSRLTKVAGSSAVDIVCQIPWQIVEGEDGKPSSDLYRLLEIGLGAHFRYVGELNTSTNIILENAFASGTTLVYGSPTMRGVHSTDLRT
ncbi:MAG: hypothetical protein WAV40_03560 [Microgenomates group bacterium]